MQVSDRLKGGKLHDVLKAVRVDFDERRGPAREALNTLAASPMEAEPALVLRRFFSSLSGVMAMLGFRELGYLARLSADLCASLGHAPELVPLLERNFSEVCALMLQATRSTQPDEARGNAPLGLMLVEGSVEMARMMEQALASDGYRLIACAEPSRLGALLEETRPDLVLVDVAQQTTDGVEVCRKLRARTAHRGMPVLALVKDDAEEQRVRELEGLGVGSTLRKPFEVVDLKGFVRRHAQRLVAARDATRRDPLTGLYHRACFEERLADQLRLSETNGECFSVALITLEGLYRLRRDHGDAAGDAALTQGGAVVRGQFRGSDLMARFEGDTFALILYAATEEAASEVVDRACARLEAGETTLSLGPSHNLPVKLSRAVVGFRSGETREQLLARARDTLAAMRFEWLERADRGKA